MTPDDWERDNPFVDPDDPRSVERERRRLEREEQRREREQKAEEKEAKAREREAEKERKRAEKEAKRAEQAEAERAEQEAKRAADEKRIAEAEAARKTEQEASRRAEEEGAKRVEQERISAPIPPPPAPGPDEEAEGDAHPAEPAPADPEIDDEGDQDFFWGEGLQPAGRKAAETRNSKRRLWRPGVLALVAAGLVVLWFFWALFQPFHGEGSGSVTVKVPRGASVGEVADLLDQEGVVSSATMFQMRVTLAGKRSELYPGAYTLASDMSYGDAIDALSTPPVRRTIVLTIPEGLSREQVDPLVEDAGVVGDYMAATESSPDLDPAKVGGTKDSSLEGFLFPATYELPGRASVDDLVPRQLDALKQRLAGIDLSYAKSKNLTVYDVLTIASMIEREVQVAKERRLVASVIYNRLKQDIPLGIDATIRYAVDNYTEPLSPEELDTESPYNTRLNLGLPPGPIGNPGEAAIEAAANPARTKFTYYVVKPYTCGEHSFSTNFPDFEQDAAEYQAALEKEGEAPTRC